MKILLMLCLVAVIGGAIGWQRYRRTEIPSIQQRAAASEMQNREADLAKSAATPVGGEWNLAPETIRTEVAKTGRVLRSRTVTERVPVDDGRIVAALKEKYVGESKLAGAAIQVECRDGEVHLTGSVKSADQVGQAMVLALETTGVRSVVSRLFFNT